MSTDAANRYNTDGHNSSSGDWARSIGSKGKRHEEGGLAVPHKSFWHKMLCTRVELRYSILYVLARKTDLCGTAREGGGQQDCYGG